MSTITAQRKARKRASSERKKRAYAAYKSKMAWKEICDCIMNVMEDAYTFEELAKYGRKWRKSMHCLTFEEYQNRKRYGTLLEELEALAARMSDAGVSLDLNDEDYVRFFMKARDYKYKSHTVHRVFSYRYFNGAKCEALIRHTSIHGGPYKHGDNFFHFPKGTEPPEWMVERINKILGNQKTVIYNKVHGTNGCFVVDEDGTTRLYWRRQKKKVPFEKMSKIQQALMMPMPAGRNHGTSRYRYLHVPRDPITFIGKKFPNETYGNIEREVKRLYGGILKFIPELYKILDLPHFKTYAGKGPVTVELCGPFAISHKHIPDGVSIAVHREQPTLHFTTYDKMMEFLRERVTEGLIICDANGIRHKMRGDRIGLMEFHETHKTSCPPNAFLGHFYNVDGQVQM